VAPAARPAKDDDLDNGTLTHRQAAIAIIDLDSGSQLLIRASLINVIFIHTGRMHTPQACNSPPNPNHLSGASSQHKSELRRSPFAELEELAPGETMEGGVSVPSGGGVAGHALGSVGIELVPERALRGSVAAASDEEDCQGRLKCGPVAPVES
jgi:hypothetical protein